jgi:hypothetical protein
MTRATIDVEDIAVREIEYHATCTYPCRAPLLHAVIEVMRRQNGDLLAAALEDLGFVRGVAGRYGTFNQAYWDECAAAILRRVHDQPRVTE